MNSFRLETIHGSFPFEQVRAIGGARGLGSRGPYIADVCPSLFASQIHSGPTFRRVGHSALLPPRLSRSRGVAPRMVRPSSVSGLKTRAHVLHVVPRRNKAFKKSSVDAFFDKLIGAARLRKLIAARVQVAGDATGFEVGHTSHYFRSQRGDKRFAVPRWPKLTGCVDIDSHFVLSAQVSVGPGRDTLEAPEILLEAASRVSIRRVLWDGGCDSEKMHAFIRVNLGAHSLIPIKSGRKTRRWPKTRYRRQMKRRFFKRLYGQRWQIESVFSRHKRRLSSELRAKTWPAQQAEVYLRVLLHNIMLLMLSLLEVFNRAPNF